MYTNLPPEDAELDSPSLAIPVASGCMGRDAARMRRETPSIMASSVPSLSSGWTDDSPPLGRSSLSAMGETDLGLLAIRAAS